ncbi:MAG: hypothetical protein ACE5E6_03600 [Phycisphaerae bacterium]
MADDVNVVRNPDFAGGKAEPRGWSWTSDSACRWTRAPGPGTGGTSVMTIESGREGGTAGWSQIVKCRRNAYYRVEATVSCDLTGPDERAGVVLSVEPIGEDGVVGARLATPGVHRTRAAVVIRTYFKMPDGVRRLRMAVGVEGAAGVARIHHVRCIRILEPDEESHVLAVPPPPLAVPPPMSAESVCVCSATADDRPLTRILRVACGERDVDTVAPPGFTPARVRADAVLMPDDKPPRALRSIAALVRLAADRIVVVSLPALAKLAGDAVRVRTIVQPDDPIHAKVVRADFATRGFALDDTFAYAWSGGAIGSFAQRQFVTTPAFKALCRRHDLLTILVSMCDQDRTSDKPICLYRATRHGGLFVLDLDPVEAPASTAGEPNLAVHLLLSILGRQQDTLGQYVVPFERVEQLRVTLRESAVRFREITVHDADAPVEEVTEQLVTIGHEDTGYGLPLAPKPVILVRSGLTSGDVESVYGAWAWFKQFVRMAPHRCPYADTLASRYRFAWLPLLADWDMRTGFRRTARPHEKPIELDLHGGSVALLVDIVSEPVNRVRVMVPTGDGAYERYGVWLHELAAAFPSGRHIGLTVGDGVAFTDHSDVAWRLVGHDVRVAVEPASFRDDIHRAVRGAGGEVVRLEVPGCDADFTARSIERTGLTATLLEHVIGLQYGVVAVNRWDTPAQLNGFPPIAPGRALIVPSDDPMLQKGATQAG